MIVDTDQTPIREEKWAGAIDPVGGKTLQYRLSTLKYGGSVATSGFTGGREVSTTVLPHILRGVNWLGIDSVQCQMNKRLKVWDRLGDDLKPTTLNDYVANEISFKELPGVLRDILDGKIRGRTIVKL
jgi:acrylyl-CoA reductase (NADPH)